VTCGPIFSQKINGSKKVTGWGNRLLAAGPEKPFDLSALSNPNQAYSHPSKLA
jgi:hypothetical protein